MQNSENLTLDSPSLPKGGGAITGLKGNINAVGPDGAASLSLPLPIEKGRGYGPELTLNYHSRSGNGSFGMGWGLNVPLIQRNTHKGVPRYDKTDSFVGPDGEILLPMLDNKGEAQIRTSSSLLGGNLGQRFMIYAYRLRTESHFSRFEYWVSQQDTAQDFWVMYSPDGQVHLLGKNPQARIVDPAKPSRVAAWLEESSVSATGEQIYWQYREEKEEAQRYLSAIWYGNKKAGRKLPALITIPSADEWLLTVVLDYGERSKETAELPIWIMPGEGDWLERADSFSSWEFGFEVRTHYLCRQVLVYSMLAAENRGDITPYLVTQLLLKYDESPCVSLLESVRQMAWEPEGTLCALPPLSFDWQRFVPPDIAVWQQREDMHKFNLHQPWQLVDLYGEGISGILYQDSGAWRYRAPVRLVEDDPDAVTWDEAIILSSIPLQRGGGRLVDLDGDGYLEWLATSSRFPERYKITHQQQWQHVIPKSAWPSELDHPQARLVAINGSGKVDLVLIGPKSVRLYSGTEEGWEKAQTQLSPLAINLPAFGSNALMMVAFSDMAGSGQQHVVAINADGVSYWPNCGYGHFSAPITMSGFSQPATSFNPEQVYLADIDGSGTTDLIYALSDHLLVYRNQSGNSFDKPFRVALPEGVTYDLTCYLQVVDLQGLGIASLVLTVPHISPHSWVCYLSTEKPYLLHSMNNNMGAHHGFKYRSSAQFWLDEKAEAVKQQRDPPPSYLPMILHILQQTEITDEITGNRLVSTARYRHGVWDGREREFRGYGFVEVKDTDVIASRGTAAEVSQPAVHRSWYATGLPDVDKQLAQEYWRADFQAFPDFTPRFTRGSGDEEQVFTPDTGLIFWLQRGMKGMLLRQESYGLDASPQEIIPYSVTENRPQIRLLQAEGAYPIVWPVIVESREYHYERINNDPQCSQQVLLSSDEDGQPLRQVSINYPRRERPAKNFYPERLPESLFESSYDEQQQILRLTLQQNQRHRLLDMEQGIWLLGLAKDQRSDIFNHDASAITDQGITLELLQKADGLLADRYHPLLGEQVQTWYLGSQGQETTDMPDFPPRVAFKEIALLDESMLTALTNNISEQNLVDSGYLSIDYLFPRSGEENKKLWAVRQGYTTYGSADRFWLAKGYRNSSLMGEMKVTRDKYDCVVVKVVDAAGLTMTVAYDWRFLTPATITDANNNIQTVTLDALGRVISRRSRGTENGQQTGYSEAVLSVPESVEEMLSLTPPLPVSQCMLYVADSWRQGQGLPPHVVALTTDRYDSGTERDQQQIRQQILFSDGFGRELQTSIRYADGEAWQRGENGLLLKRLSQTTRWAISGRTEYDNKGQPIRTYQPYFLDSWQYVIDDSLREESYADTYCYDPLGRVWQIITAKGYVRRTFFLPWLVVDEDENDTLDEIDVV